MKDIMLKISIYFMTAIIFTASVGVNVFKHICGDCHETYFTLDDGYLCDQECSCAGKCHCNARHHDIYLFEEMESSEDSESTSHKCAMHSHNHEYYHINELYLSPSKIIVSPAIILNQLLYCNQIIEPDNADTHFCLSLRHIVNSYRPDISITNCCFII
jgi:hypothetical protein